MTEKRRDYLEKSGATFLADLATNNLYTTDETIEAIACYFANPSDDEIAWFFDSLAAAGAALLRQNNLPTSIKELHYLEVLMDSHCRHQPKQNPERARYWEQLKNDPEVRLFTNQKLIAAYRLQAASINLMDAWLSKRPNALVAESITLTMLVIRAGVFDQVQKAMSFPSGKRKGATAIQTQHIRQLAKDNRAPSAKSLRSMADEKIIGDMKDGTFQNQVTAARKLYPKERCTKKEK